MAFALLTPEQQAAERSLFGQDIYCLDSLSTGRYARGKDVLRQNIYRRLTTAPGTLVGGEEEADYGLDLVGMLGQVVTPTEQAAVPGRVRAELLKDPRVEDVAAVLTRTAAPPATAWTLRVDVVTAEGPFDLTIGVSGITAALLRVPESL